MADPSVLPVELREASGKGAARAVRRAGYIPGVVYGGGEKPLSIKLRENELNRTVNRGRFFSQLVELDLDGKRVRAIPRDMQLDVVRDLPIHVDFLRLSPRSLVAVYIPVTFVNEEASPGLKRGGVLNIVRHEVELKVRAADIPEVLVADLTGLDIGDVVHISAIPLPKGASLTITDRDFSVATIASPSALAAQIREEQEAEAAAAAEDVEEIAEAGEEGEQREATDTGE